MFCVLPKIYRNPRMIITKTILLDLAFHRCTNRFLFHCTLKIIFFQVFFDVWFSRYYCFRNFFSKKCLFVTFDIVNFAHQMTYHWKAFVEYISNIYIFMGEKCFNFNVKTLIIFGIWPKIHLNTLSHDNYLDLACHTCTNRFLFQSTLKINFFQVFSMFPF